MSAAGVAPKLYPSDFPRFVGSDLGIDLLGAIPAISAVFACSRLRSSDVPSNQRAYRINSSKTAAPIHSPMSQKLLGRIHRNLPWRSMSLSTSSIWINPTKWLNNVAWM
jgi:hypothetical protein